MEKDNAKAKLYGPSQVSETNQIWKNMLLR